MNVLVESSYKGLLVNFEIPTEVFSSAIESLFSQEVCPLARPPGCFPNPDRLPDSSSGRSQLEGEREPGMRERPWRYQSALAASASTRLWPPWRSFGYSSPGSL